MKGHPRAGSIGAAETAGTESRSVPDLRRLAGEDAPIWLATGFAAVGTLIAIASVLAWLQAPLTVTAPAPPVAAANTAAEPNRLAEDATPQQLPAGAQNNAAGSTEPQSPVAAPSEPVAASSGPVAAPSEPAAAPSEPAAATRQPEREAAKPQVTQAAAGAVSVPPYCFSALNIPFARNSALPITIGLGQSIEHLRRLMTEHPEATLLVEGHTDSTGTEQYNVLLSFSRAKAVADLLRHLGIPLRRMTVRAAGASEAKDKAGLASDRRAFLRIEGVENCNGAEGATEKQ
jgi:outer membrane protein OmpA-like peptidoglycan-associated protein